MKTYADTSFLVRIYLTQSDSPKALAFMPERTLAPGEDRLVRTGRPVEADELGSGEDHVRLTIDGELVAVAERHGGLLRPVTVIAE